MPQSARDSDQLLGLNINNSTGGASEFEALFNMLLGKNQTITLVKVVAVNATGVAPVGTVSVQPMVHQLDGAGNIYPLGVIHDVPYFRLQGGSNAVICDPVVGDIGFCGFASRDISTVKRNKAASAPGSRRQYAWSDGLYIGGFLNGAPSQYVHFTGSGIVIKSPTKITLEAPEIEVNGQTVTTTANSVSTQTATFSVSATSTAQFTGGGGIDSDGDIKSSGISLKTHTHSGVTTGGGNTGGPQ